MLSCVAEHNSALERRAAEREKTRLYDQDMNSDMLFLTCVFSYWKYTTMMHQSAVIVECIVLYGRMDTPNQTLAIPRRGHLLWACKTQQ